MALNKHLFRSSKKDAQACPWCGATMSNLLVQQKGRPGFWVDKRCHKCGWREWTLARLEEKAK